MTDLRQPLPEELMPGQEVIWLRCSNTGRKPVSVRVIWARAGQVYVETDTPAGISRKPVLLKHIRVCEPAGREASDSMQGCST